MRDIKEGKRPPRARVSKVRGISVFATTYLDLLRQTRIILMFTSA